MIKHAGADLVDETEVGNYTIALLKVSDSETRRIVPTDYQLALQRDDTESTDPEQQFKKFDFKPFTFEQVKEIVEKVKEWSSKYGKIAVASFNPEKTAKYKRVLIHFGLDVDDRGQYLLVRGTL